jgi:hypothetical protein
MIGGLIAAAAVAGAVFATEPILVLLTLFIGVWAGAWIGSWIVVSSIARE